jgi:hypothetical protein
MEGILKINGRTVRYQNQIVKYVEPNPADFTFTTTITELTYNISSVSLIDYGDGNTKNNPIGNNTHTYQPPYEDPVSKTIKVYGNITNILLDNEKITSADLSRCASVMSNIYISNNYLTTFPDMSNITTVNDIYLNNNKVSGFILPAYLGDINITNNLILNNSQISGEIPANWYNLNQTQILNLNLNNLTGSIDFLSGLTSATDISLNMNELEGPLPDLTNLVNLTILDLFDNNLTGGLNNLSGLTSLQLLHLFDNNFSDNTTDLDFSLLTNLQNLNLSHNNLNGTIDFIKNNTNLNNINFSSNDFSGQPFNFEGFNQLQYLSLYDNNFSGNLDFITGNTNVITLNLKQNDFSGVVPNLNYLTNLNYLNICENPNLDSSLTWINDLPSNLNSLYFSDCNFSGTIPDISHLKVTGFFSENNSGIIGWESGATIYTGLTNFRLNNCNLSQEAVDNVLYDFYTNLINRPTSGYLYLYNNAAPSSTGLTYKTAIIDHGWNVSTA